MFLALYFFTCSFISDISDILFYLLYALIVASKYNFRMNFPNELKKLW